MVREHSGKVEMRGDCVVGWKRVGPSYLLEEICVLGGMGDWWGGGDCV